MTTPLDSAASILERVAFLDAMSSQLSTVSNAPWDSTGLMFASYLAATALFIIALGVSVFLFDKKSPKAYASLTLTLICGLIAFAPAQEDKVAKLVKIDAAMQGLPPTEILFELTGDTELSNAYMPSFIAADFSFNLEQRISHEKSALEVELARIEFAKSGELEKLKRELLQSALKAEKSGVATAEQMALLHAANK